jgi:hypothetical protein
LGVLEMITECRHAVRGFRDFETIAPGPRRERRPDRPGEQGEVI